MLGELAAAVVVASLALEDAQSTGSLEGLRTSGLTLAAASAVADLAPGQVLACSAAGLGRPWYVHLGHLPTGQKAAGVLRLLVTGSSAQCTGIGRTLLYIKRETATSLIPARPYILTRRVKRDRVPAVPIHAN